MVAGRVRGRPAASSPVQVGRRSSFRVTAVVSAVRETRAQDDREEPNGRSTATARFTRMQKRAVEVQSGPQIARLKGTDGEE